MKENISWQTNNAARLEKHATLNADLLCLHNFTAPHLTSVERLNKA